MTRKKTWIIGISVLALLVPIGILVTMTLLNPSLIDTKVLKSLPHRDESKVDTSHLAPGIIPPTNKWFSGIALQKIPKTIFPTPLSVSLTESTVAYGLPTIVPSNDVITGAMAENVKISIDSAVSYVITRYDELSVDISYRNNQKQVIATLTMTAGSPYVQLHSDIQSSYNITSTLGTPKISGSTATFASSKGPYSVAGFNNVAFKIEADKLRVKVPKNGLLTMYAAPNKMAADTLGAYAGSRVIGSEVSYAKKDDTYVTKIRVKTDNNKPTVYSYLPHHTNTDSVLFSYDTLYGEQRIVAGNDFSFTTKVIPVVSELDVSNITQDEKNLVSTTLKKDIVDTKYTANDSYYSGKQLYRSAQLLQLANQLGDKESAEQIRGKLKSELVTWLSKPDARAEKYFYYDSSLQTVVGVQPSFGSQENNDHHFHYGYFIYAASVLGSYDSDFLKTYRAQVDLLVADIANYKTGQELPLRRNFDVYFGHSWASGSAPFNDGNNQESSSEAINAWIASSLWAKQTGNNALETEADWMLSNEASSTSEYWMNIDTTKKPYNTIYTHSLVSLNWSGKREYGTFFSAEPSAKLGIQLLPMSPTQAEISSGNSNRKKHIDEAVNGTYDLPFGDYMLMYNTDMSTRDRLAIAKQLPDEVIDGANSRSYMYALLLSQKK